MSRFSNLEDWLSWMETLHPKSIDLGLHRVSIVAQHLGLVRGSSDSRFPHSGDWLTAQDVEQPAVSSASANCHVITVAGTNGKGSCIRVLEAVLVKQGQSVGSYTSPHLHHYNERICINGQPVSDTLICDAFAAIDRVRRDISLTYFEFGTLAALLIFQQAGIGYLLLEVGLGGRLDAVNIVNPNIAIITSIDLDHQQWLGSDRDGIASEKLGIARPGKPLVIAESRLTPHLAVAADWENTVLVERDFQLTPCSVSSQRFTCDHYCYEFPTPNLPLDSVGAALAALCCLPDILDKQQSSEVGALLTSLSIPGRYQSQHVAGCQVIYDVAHNPMASRLLASRLFEDAVSGQTYIVFNVMSDKDTMGVLQPMMAVVNHWCIGDLPNVPRSSTASDLVANVESLGATASAFPSVVDAFRWCLSHAGEQDRIVVFGSFYTVAAVQASFIEKQENTVLL